MRSVEKTQGNLVLNLNTCAKFITIKIIKRVSMTDQQNSNQIVREFKQLDVKEPDPSSLNVRELRGRNISKELHTPSIRQPPPGPIHLHGTVQNLVKRIFAYHNHLPQSSSDLDTDQDEIIDEMLKQVVQTVNWLLLKTTTGNPASNLDSSNTPHDNTSDRQSTPTLNTSSSDIHKHITTSPKDTYKPDWFEHIVTNLIKNFEKKKTNYYGHRCFIIFPHPT